MLRKAANAIKCFQYLLCRALAERKHFRHHDIRRKDFWRILLTVPTNG